MNRLFSFIVTLLLALESYGQPFNRARMDSLFSRLADKNLAMGSITISRNGIVIYQRSFANGQSAQTEYRIGSITKMFTAVMIYQLIEEKKLALNDTLSQFFSQLPNAGKITISNMLGHRSGLPNFTNHTNYDDWKDQPKTHDELLEMIRGQQSDFEPNAKADYNNSNYLLLGYIIEKVCKKTYKEILNERIINRIGLSQTYYGDHAGFERHEAISYKYFDNEWKQDKAAYLDNFGGAGAIISTPSDLCKFITALFAGKLISNTSLSKMKAMVDGYGMGMFPYGSQDHPGFGHNGKTEGFASSISYYLENKLSIAYCTNGEVYPKAAILDDVFNICFNLPCILPTFEPIAINERKLDQYTGTFTADGSNMQVVSSKDGGQLLLETKGQKLKLEALSADQFMNKQYGFFFEFHNDGKKLIIKDVDDVYELFKK